MRVQYDVMAKEFERVLAKKGFSPEDAKNAAVIFAQNSLAGGYSHEPFPQGGKLPGEGRD